MKSSIQPENILRCMTAEVRKSIGQKSAAEAEATCAVRLERDLHRQIVSDLLRRRSEGQAIHFIHSRMDKRTTTDKGVADFVVIRSGMAICLEIKIGSNKLSVEQEGERLRVIMAGGQYWTVRTFDEYRKAVP